MRMYPVLSTLAVLHVPPKTGANGQKIFVETRKNQI
jgi:hypothetical protein